MKIKDPKQHKYLINNKLKTNKTLFINTKNTIIGTKKNIEKIGSNTMLA